MKKLFLLLGGAVASVAMGFDGNILCNGSLTADQVEVPSWWTLSGGTKSLVCEPSGGPEGCPAVRFDAARDPDKAVTLRQYGLTLASNGAYRVSCRVRAKSFKATREAAFLIINHGWTHTVGVKIPNGTYGWRRLEKIVTVAPSADFSAAVHLPRFRGELTVADLAIEPADAATAAATGPSEIFLAANELRFVPLAPLLSAIPESTRTANFELDGRPLDAKPAACAVFLACGGTRRELPYPAEKQFSLALPSAPTGGTFTLSVCLRADGRPLHARTFFYRTVQPVPAAEAGRRLNALVTERVRETVDAGTTRTWPFTLAVPGWVFVSAAAESVTLDGARVITPETPRQETFRLLAAGRHILSVRNARGGEAILRSIPELFDYCPNKSIVPEGPSFDWDFQERNVLPAVTVINGGHIPPEQVASVHARGYRWLANLISRDLTGPEDLVNRLAAHPGMNEPRYDGVTCDEQFFGSQKMISRFAKGLWAAADRPGRSIYTWIVGLSANSSADRDFISAAVNASRGTGKLLTEIYLSSCATEEEARGHIRRRLVGAVENIRGETPWAIPNYGIILGNFTQPPGISLAVYPEVDYRYYLDMQFNLIANDPAFAGLGCTGVWGSYYADAELHRWTFRLMRHYFVEGHREMLSGKYGLRYLPGHLSDGDFRAGLAKWAAKGTVAAASKRGLGAVERRWHGADVGDTYAVFTRGAEPSTLTQKLVGLVPGKRYSLGFGSFDATFPTREKSKSRAFGITASFADGATVCRDLSWEHINRTQKMKKRRGPFDTKVNFTFVVFEATAAEATLVLDDARVAPGGKVGINNVSVRPLIKDAATPSPN